MKPIRVYNRILGLLLILLGGMLLITSPSLFDLLHYAKTYWPVLLILCGLHLLCKDRPQPSR